MFIRKAAAKAGDFFEWSFMGMNAHAPSGTNAAEAAFVEAFWGTINTGDESPAYRPKLVGAFWGTVNTGDESPAYHPKFFGVFWGTVNTGLPHERDDAGAKACDFLLGIVWPD
jgi:hypothetical protein